MIDLHYTIHGEGRPVVILHGLFGSSRNWHGITRTLGKEHHIITPDLRNHGQSPHIDSMLYLEMASDVTKMIKERNLTDVILIGHSMGGKVAMTSVLSEPELFSALVVVDIAPVDYSHDFHTMVDAMMAIELDRLKNRNEAEAQLVEAIPESGVRQFILTNLTRSGDQFQWRNNLHGIKNNLDEIISFPSELSDRSSRIPALFIGGSNSDYVRSVHNPEIYRFFPAAEILMIEDAGHWLHSEKPNDFIQHVREFINYI